MARCKERVSSNKVNLKMFNVDTAIIGQILFSGPSSVDKALSTSFGKQRKRFGFQNINFRVLCIDGKIASHFVLGCTFPFSLPDKLHDSFRWSEMGSTPECRATKLFFRNFSFPHHVRNKNGNKARSYPSFDFLIKKLRSFVLKFTIVSMSKK